MAGNDFVEVQLTAFGAEFADGLPLTVSNGRRSFTFTPGQTTRVEKSYEWNAFLASYHSPSGEKFFELVPAPPAPVVVLKPATPVPAVPAAPEKETT